MPIDRKTFISKVALGSGGLMLGPPAVQTGNRPGFTIPADFSIRYLATRWGYRGTLDHYCQAASEAGYDGIEEWLPGSQAEQEQLFRVAENHGLEVGLLVGSGSQDFNEHLEQFRQDIDRAAALNPLYINCHSGRDYFTFEQNRQLIDYTTRVQAASGVRISHETHRSRMLFAAHITRQFLDELPELRLTLDISHWCTVHESLLQDQPEAVSLALERTDHIHARVGHRQGPQVTDPGAPEWEREVAAHFGWWDRVVEQKISEGGRITVLTEFGPPAYMPTVPFTGMPLADQWQINTGMMNLWKERYR
ncbi:MAG: TIM barrel protein [Balneolaceae bacterium]